MPAGPGGHRGARIRLPRRRRPAVFSELALPKLLAGKRVSVPAGLDAPHSWAVPAPRLTRIPDPLLRLAGLTDSRIRAFWEMRYQFQRPFVIDATAAAIRFGSAATPLDTALREMIDVPPRRRSRK